MKRTLTSAVTALVIFFATHSVVAAAIVHPTMEQSAHTQTHAEQSCDNQNQACQSSIACATICLEAASIVKDAPLALPLVIGILLLVVAWQAMYTMGVRFFHVRNFWYPPRYLFETIILRE